MDLMESNLKAFCNYFIRSFEEILIYSKNLLEENTDLKQKPASKAMAVAEGVSNAIPKVGNVVSTAIKESRKFINNRIDKQNASDIALIAYSSSDDKDTLRNNLIEGAYTIFSCYEYQFSKVTCETGGVTRAMLKIAQDASNRLFTYLLEHGTIEVITGEIVAKGILYGQSNKAMLKVGRTLNIIEDKKSTISTMDFFTNCGIRIQRDDTLTYYVKEKHVPNLGHRLLFEFEDQNLPEAYRIDSPTYSHKYNFINCNRQDKIEGILSYVARQNPLEELKEFAKFISEEQQNCFKEASTEREHILSKILEDSAEKATALHQSIRSSERKIDLVISKTDRILEKHGEILTDSRDGPTTAISNILVAATNDIIHEGQLFGKRIVREACANTVDMLVNEGQKVAEVYVQDTVDKVHGLAKEGQRIGETFIQNTVHSIMAQANQLGDACVQQSEIIPQRYQESIDEFIGETRGHVETMANTVTQEVINWLTNFRDFYES